MKVAALYYYPVKSMRGIRADSLMPAPHGFEFDRCWLVAAPDGRFITARQHPQMVLWQAQPTADGLRLTAPNGETLDVFYRDHMQPHNVTVWRDTFTAYSGSPATDRWLSERIGFACRLFYLGASAHRTLPHNGGALSFADGAPYLLTHTASLDALNRLLAEPADMRRFRANIVVEGGEAFAEDGWRHIRIGGTVLENFKPCSRCVLITVDPDTGAKHPKTEPLATLAKIRKSADGVCFGINLALVRAGPIRVGDAVEVLD